MLKWKYKKTRRKRERETETERERETENKNLLRGYLMVYCLVGFRLFSSLGKIEEGSEKFRAFFFS